MKRDKLDALWSQLVRMRAKWCCEFDGKYFGKSRGLQAAHCFSRGRKSTRYHPDCGTSLCTFHHYYLDGNPILKEQFFRKRLGDKKYEALKKLADKPFKLSQEDRVKIEADLRNKIETLEE